jgi:hypothetical protein
MISQGEINLLQLLIRLDGDLQKLIKQQPKPLYRIDIIKNSEIIKKG